MLDLSRFREPKPAPKILVDALLERRTRARFMVETADGDFRAVTWGAYAKQMRHAALFLAASGFERGERAAIFAPNRVEWMSSALAIQAAGGVMVPIYPASTSAQAGYVISHSDARFVFVDTAPLLRRVFERFEEYAAVERFVLLDDALDPSPILAELRAAGKDVPAAAEVERRFVTWSRALAVGASKDAESPRAFDERLAQIRLQDSGLMLYTSGTTGNPKGVPLTFENTYRNGQDWLEVNAPILNEGAVDLLWLPMSHIFGFGQACLGNNLGFTTYLTEPAKVLELMPAVRPDVFMSVPAYWEKLAQRAGQADGPDARRLRLRELTGGRLSFCLSGGAGLKREVKELFHEAGMLIIEGYGLTECSPTLTMNRADAFRFDSVGKPFPSVELKLADDGEILARGPNIFAGYHKDPAATREVFTEDGWFKTGDVGRMTDDGFLQIIDRKKEILVTAGGKNIPPQNIELRFADHPIVSHAVVYGDGKKYLVAGIWLNHEELDAELLRRKIPLEERDKLAETIAAAAVAKVNEELASYEQIKRFRVMDAPLTVAGGMLTSTLKVRRKKVYEAFGRELEALYES